ncbi:MAG: site-specific DNA-methyltransferase, partial [Lactococcus lactis]|nr:site-specific DNA-methyltransferase [Lactococcus lactis]
MTNKTNFIYNEDAREMEELKQSIVDLVITSPPYFNLVDYKSSKQIGFAETYQRYLQSLNQVWKRCIDSLKDDGTICINVCSTVEITRKNQNCYYDIKHDIEKYFVNHGFYIE